MFILTLLVHLTLLTASNARTWNVQVDGLGDAPTIQAAIDSAAAADTVLVAMGVYFENLAMSKPITLLSESGPKLTVIDGQRLNRVLKMRSGTVSGFTIRNGQLPPAQGPDAFAGAGIFVDVLTVTRITDNIIEHNAAGPLDVGVGGGIWVSAEADSCIIQRNTVSMNTAGDAGGGVFASGKTLLQHNLIYGNGSGIGGGVFSVVGHLEGNFIANNTVRFHGGGVWASVNVYMINNTLVNNVTSNSLRNGAGLSLSTDAGVTSVVTHNIFAGNHADVIVGGRFGAAVDCRGQGSAVFTCNLFWDNDINGIVGPCNAEVEQSLNQDPLFCSADSLGVAGPYFLDQLSPAATGSCGLIGALPAACTTVSASATSFGRIKQLFR